MDNGNVNNNNKNYNNSARAVSEFQEDSSVLELEGWFAAYYSCRKNKSRSCNACKFELHYEKNIISLWRDVKAMRYQPTTSIAFIITKPVKREIFAADFRDRVVHHWIAQRIEPLLERKFISDSYNCRKDKGTIAGINKVSDNIREVSANYTADCWVMKLDLKGFFMSIDRALLTDKLCAFIDQNYQCYDKDTLLYLIRVTIMNAPENNCCIKGGREQWNGIDSHKSLFTNRAGFGLPIGNLTSQISANFLLDDADHFITENLGLRMVRYVDDYCIVDRDKQRLLDAVPKIRDYLIHSANVTLHPKKFYLQHYSKGVKFIGAVIKRDRIYISNRTVASAECMIYGMNAKAKNKRWIKLHVQDFVTSMNSYLGLMQHFSTFRIRRKLIGMIGREWWRYINTDKHYKKLIVRKQYKSIV